MAVQRDTGRITEEDLQTALKLIREAKKPYVFVGGGAVISGASEDLREFVDKIDAPVCDSLRGKGAFDGTDPRYTGMLGMHGTKTSNYGVSECDLLIAIGVRFSDRVLGNAKKFANQAKILQLDVDPAEINKNIVVTASVIGDVKEILGRLDAQLAPMEHKEWMDHILHIRRNIRSPIIRRLKRTVYRRAGLQVTKGEADQGHRGRTASDVDGAVLPLCETAHAPYFRRPWNDGLRTWRSDRRTGGESG